MKRRRTKLVVFLLLGAIVNVAVAGGCAVFSEVSTVFPLPTQEVDGLLRPRLAIPPRGSARYWGTDDRGFGRSRLSLELRDETTAPRTVRNSYLFIHADGWPARALQGESLSGEHFAPRRLRHAAQIPAWLVRDGFQTRLPSSHVLGLRPIWLGFAFNTIFYAALLWLLTLGPITARRIIRHKRGLCFNCGHDLRGARHDVCPECGRGVRAMGIVVKTRKAKAFWIGFLAPVIPGCGCVIAGLIADVHDGGEISMADLPFVLFVIGSSILPGLVIGSVAAACTRNKPGPLECGKCGYSLIGLTSDKCPECGQELSARATP